MTDENENITHQIVTDIKYELFASIKMKQIAISLRTHSHLTKVCVRSYWF